MGPAPFLLALLAPASAAPPPDAGAVSVPTGRMTELRAMPDVGQPVDGALARAGGPYAAAAAADGGGRFREAANLYHQAVVERGRLGATGDRGALAAARDKAEHERQRSLVLESLILQRAPGGDARAPGFVLERARLYRLKMMAVRAVTGAVSPMLYRGARDGFREVLRGLRERSLSGKAAGKTPDKMAGDLEAHLLLCATLAVGGERDEARLELAAVRQGDREDPQSALPMATCLAALGETDAALRRLEVALRRGGGDTGAAREIYLRNDWDHLRDLPRFDRLFPR